jgi:hypothetical protein
MVNFKCCIFVIFLGKKMDLYIYIYIVVFNFFFVCKNNNNNNNIAFCHVAYATFHSRQRGP